MNLGDTGLAFDPSLLLGNEECQSIPKADQLLRPHSAAEARPSFSRRASYDLFECIEQSKYKRLSENQARYVFAQVVEAVYYLESQGITHCDIKDENLVIDSDLTVCFLLHLEMIASILIPRFHRSNSSTSAVP